MQNCRQQRRAGFTLIEVLVALGLFTLASGVLIQSAMNAIRAYESVKPDSNHEQLYRFMVRSIVSIEDREEFEDGGDFELPDDYSATWEAEVEETEMLDLFHVTITIELQGDTSQMSDSEERIFEVYLYRAEWSEDGEREQLLKDRRSSWEDRKSGF